MSMLYDNPLQTYYGATLARAPDLLANIRLGQNLLEVTNAIIAAVKVLYYRSVVIRKKK